MASSTRCKSMDMVKGGGGCGEALEQCVPNGARREALTRKGQ